MRLNFYALLPGILLSAISAMQPLHAQYNRIPNAGFEDWVFTGTYYEPFYWNTYNLLSEYGCTAFVAPDSSPVSGKLAIRISTLACTTSDKQFTDTVAGIISLGERDAPSGLAANRRPTKFSFYMKYQPSTGDSAAVVLLFTRTIRPGVKENVGVAYHIEGKTLPTWTRIELPIIWLKNEVPDTVQLVCTSSKCVFDNKKPKQPGSILWLDELSTDNDIWQTGNILQVVPESMQVFPNPLYGRGLLHVSLPDSREFSYRIFSSKGCLLAEGYSKEKTLDPAELGLPDGIYMLQVQQRDFSGSARIGIFQEP
jgi:hypothetical protein